MRRLLLLVTVTLTACANATAPAKTYTCRHVSLQRSWTFYPCDSVEYAAQGRL